MPAPSGPVVTDETRKVADLKVDPRNARRHSEAQIAQIVRSIEDFGYVNRIAIQPGGQLIGGHATLESFKRLSRETIEVRVVAGLTPTQYVKLGLALNRIPENSSWDEDLLAEIVGDLSEAGEDLTGVGFSAGEIDKLLADPGSLEVREIETAPVEDEFWISIRGRLVHQAGALKAIEAALKPYSDVTVELGTINIG
jgi:ParB-like chromosome segregation protein Spo0J